MRVRIRDATLDDMASLQILFRQSSLSNAGDRENLLAHPEVLELTVAAVNAGRTRVAFSEDRILGFSTAVGGDDVVELDALFVDPVCMKRGVGTALVRDLVATASEQGIRRVEVTANEHARAFYESVGFIDDGITHTRFGPAPRMYLDIA